MKKTTKKLITAISCALIGSSIFAGTIVSTACTNTNAVTNNSSTTVLNVKNNDSSYKYDNKIFSTLDDLATYYINKHPETVSSNFYLGDVNSSILDPSTSMLDINNFKPYNPSKIHPVYLNALNMPTPDYNAAKNTYANRGLIDYKYYDFNNNIFDSYEEARQSIINSKIATGVMYYDDLELSESDEPIKFNPLSKKDLLRFKKIAFQNAITSFDGQQKTNFDLKIYNDNSDNEFENIISSNFIHKLVSESIDSYFEIKRKVLENSLFDIVVSLVDDNRGDRNFIFTNFWTKNSNDIKLLNQKSISFKNTSFSNLKEFNAFINRQDFFKKFNVTIKHKDGLVGNYMSEEAETSSFLNSKFSIKLIGNGNGDACPLWNADYKILAHGDAMGTRNYLAFKVDAKIQLNENKENFKTIFKRNISE
ncbi:MAG: hypothetical protein K2K73_00670, partial [Ureaplasma sp.]|nr:hypothetical protein [Ureaplasma sp.]